MKVFVYKVRKNDTLEKIAGYYKVSTKQISPQKFTMGDRVVIKLQDTKCYIVMPGDTLEKISQKLNVPLQDLKNKNIEPLFVGKHLIV